MNLQPPNVIVLPSYLTARSMEESVAICNLLAASDRTVTVDACNLRFIDPLGIALLGATLYTLENKGIKVRVRNLSETQAGYLQRMEVFSDVDIEECNIRLTNRRDRSDALVELTRLDTQEQVDQVARKITHALVGSIPGIDFDERPDEMSGHTQATLHEEPIEYALSELLENSMTHARNHGYQKACVWVACQHYPSNNLIRLGIVDSGCGFLASLSKHPNLGEQTHLDAILLALMPRVSCNRDLRWKKDESVNQGVGLTTTARIAQRAGGRLIIASGDAVHNTIGGPNTYLTEGTYWQGVAIAMECQRSRLPKVKFRELLPSIDTGKVGRLRFQ
jgi:anti-sigma regulatory factor (Ser/Thr protein kinase)/anti-anti-sigma regulatory factor